MVLSESNLRKNRRKKNGKNNLKSRKLRSRKQILKLVHGIIQSVGFLVQKVDRTLNNRRKL